MPIDLYGNASVQYTVRIEEEQSPSLQRITNEDDVQLSVNDPRQRELDRNRFWVRNGNCYKLWIEIDQRCELVIRFKWWSCLIEVPTCYRNYISGLCGDFRNRNYDKVLERCDGSMNTNTRTWSGFEKSEDGGSWERTYRDQYCPIGYLQWEDTDPDVPISWIMNECEEDVSNITSACLHTLLTFCTNGTLCVEDHCLEFKCHHRNKEWWFTVNDLYW